MGKIEESNNTSSELKEIKEVVLYIAGEIKEFKQETRDKFTVLEDKFDGLEGKFDGLESRFDGLEDRFAGIEEKFSSIEDRLTSLEDGHISLEDRFSSLENKATSKFDMVDENRERLIKLELMMENEIIPKIDLIYESYSDMNKKFDEAIKTTNTYNFIEFKVNNLKNDYEDTKQQLLDNGYIVKN